MPQIISNEGISSDNGFNIAGDGVVYHHAKSRERSAWFRVIAFVAWVPFLAGITFLIIWPTKTDN